MNYRLQLQYPYFLLKLEFIISYKSVKFMTFENAIYQYIGTTYKILIDVRKQLFISYVITFSKYLLMVV